MHDMRHLCPLVPQTSRIHGQAPHGAVRIGQTVDVLWTRAPVPKAQGGAAGCGGRAGGLGREVVGLTAKEWLR
jgi:hypothetical protein